jgi:hypothetical protein
MAKGAGKLPLYGFLIGFGIALVIGCLIYWWNERDNTDVYTLLMGGLFFGSIGGVLVGAILAACWEMWEPLYWSLVKRDTTRDPALTTVFAQLPEVDEEDPFAGEWRSYEPPDSDESPGPVPPAAGPIPPSVELNIEQTDAFRPAP